MPTNLKCFLSGLVVCALLAVGGCGKKETPPPTAPVSETPGNAGNPAAATTQTPEQAAVAERAIAFFRGAIERKDYPRARTALRNVESMPLTPAQRKTVDELKAQIPAGQ